MKIAKGNVNNDPLTAMIEKCLNEDVKYLVLGNEKLPLAKPLKARKARKVRKAKKWKKITIFVVKTKKNGEKQIIPKIRKIPIELKTPSFKPKAFRIWLPKTNQKLYRAYFS